MIEQLAVLLYEYEMDEPHYNDSFYYPKITIDEFKKLLIHDNKEFRDQILEIWYKAKWLAERLKT